VDCYFFFFAGAFLVAFLAAVLVAAFLVAFFIRSILPNVKFCNLNRSQRDSYINSFAREVKKKMLGRMLRAHFSFQGTQKRKIGYLFYSFEEGARLLIGVPECD
jgi:hypothetical protein